MRGRLAALPACLREVAARVQTGSISSGGVVVTGIGASEAPARLMAELLRASRGASAVFAPLSAFAAGAAGADPTGTDDGRGRSLVVFSQGLSPNACLALARAREFEHATLFTSAREGAQLARFVADGGHVVRLPPEREEGALVRVLGPSAAMLAAALYTGAASARDVDALLATLARDTTQVAPAPTRCERVAFVTAGGYGERCHAVKNTWLEALSAPEPPMWDVLQIAHGPFQQFFDAEIVLFALEREGAESELWDRLARMLVPARHTLVRLRSVLPGALAPIDHLAQVLAIVCRALEASPRDLGAWPGSGLDAPLYELGRETS